MDKLMMILPPERLLIVFGVLSSLIMGYETLRRKHPIRTVLLGGGSGVLSLVACHLWGAAVGCYLPFSLLHLGVAFVLGIPGVLLMLGAAAL